MENEQWGESAYFWNDVRTHSCELSRTPLGTNDDAKSYPKSPHSFRGSVFVFRETLIYDQNTEQYRHYVIIAYVRFDIQTGDQPYRYTFAIVNDRNHAHRRVW